VYESEIFCKSEASAGGGVPSDKESAASLETSGPSAAICSPVVASDVRLKPLELPTARRSRSHRLGTLAKRSFQFMLPFDFATVVYPKLAAEFVSVPGMKPRHELGCRSIVQQFAREFLPCSFRTSVSTITDFHQPKAFDSGFMFEVDWF